MKKIILFLVVILNVAIIRAQDQCLTTAPEPPQWIFNKSAKSLLTSTSYSMNIFVHIVRSSSGVGLGTEVLATIVNSLNGSFQGTDIQFSLLGSEFIDNDYYYTNLSGKESELFGVNANCNAIDIYVLGKSTIWTYNGYGIAGMAESIPSTALIMHGNYYDASSLPHEMGHCLGLYHTHHGTVHEGGDTNECAELVDGSNSAVCGDYISDTPADPNKWSINSCSYVGSGVDANGNSYNPSVSNLMSYASKTCRTLYSDLQISRMKAFIDNTPMLQNTFASTLSGPSIVCSSGATFIINNLPPVNSIVWTPGPGLTITSGQNTASCTFSATGNGLSWVQATLVTGCGSSLTLPQFAVWTGVLPKPTSIIGFASNGKQFGSDSYYDFSVRDISPLANATYDWHVGGGTILWGQGTNTITVKTGTVVNNDIYFSVDVRANNSCGSSSYFLRTGFVVSGAGGATRIIISPNPSTGETTLELADSNMETLSQDTQWDIEVYDAMQALKTKLQKIKGSKQTINTSGWKDGVYVVRAMIGNKTINEKLVVKH